MKENILYLMVSTLSYTKVILLQLVLLCEGAISPDDILRVLGPSAVREYLVNEIQEVYRLQGVKLMISILKSLLIK